MAELTLGSLFDGSGGFPLGGLQCGITPLWASEIEPFPIRVTTKRLPQVRHLGDINKINGAEVPPVDIITGGFCCQDLSCAGKRAGLHGERSGLFFQVIRIIKEMREATHNEYPKFAVLENVPGMYSSNKGMDFLEVLNELVKIKNENLSVPLPKSGRWDTAGEIVGDGFSLAYRTLDAQFWGVAQRRRRCYIVVDFTGERAGQILFDESRLQRDSSPSGAARQGSAGDFTDRVGIPSGINGDVAGTLDANYFKGTGARNGVERDVVAFEPGATSRMKSNYAYTEVCGTLRAKMGDNQAAVAIPINTQVGLRNHKDGDGTGLGVGIADSPAYTLQAAHSHAVAIENHPADSRIKVSEDGIVQTLPGRMGTGGGNVPLVMNDSAVRAYGISSYESNAMKSPNPHSGVYEADTSKTLDTLGGRPDCRQGGVAVVAVQGSMIGRKDENGPQGSGINENISFTLTGTDKHAVCYQDSIGTLCASDYKFPQQQQIEEGKAVVEQVTFGKNGFGRWNDKPAALKASGGDFPGGENIVVENRYVVRRLTPQECALLQGFPVDWCSGLETPEPTEEDIAFWTEVWETDRLIKGTSSKPKSRKQIIKWLKDPHSDSAEYKMWGNGVALPCVEFVLSGIVHFA